MQAKAGWMVCSIYINYYQKNKSRACFTPKSTLCFSPLKQISVSSCWKGSFNSVWNEMSTGIRANGIMFTVHHQTTVFCWKIICAAWSPDKWWKDQQSWLFLVLQIPCCVLMLGHSYTCLNFINFGRTADHDTIMVSYLAAMGCDPHYGWWW